MISSQSEAAGSPSKAACTSVASTARRRGRAARKPRTMASACSSQSGQATPLRAAWWRMALRACSNSLESRARSSSSTWYSRVELVSSWRPK